jgi:quercetin dioxygenase-like cupin family protein
LGDPNVQGEHMKAFIASALALAPLFALADPDPSVMAIKREADIKWVENPAAPGLKFALLSGNPPAPGPYVIRVRFAPGAMSPPHLHPEERQIVVLKGTWWVGAGPKWDRENLSPVPAGGFVVHHANQIHYDGARDEEVIVQISGNGTNATTLVNEAGNPK